MIQKILITTWVIEFLLADTYTLVQIITTNMPSWWGADMLWITTGFPFEQNKFMLNFSSSGWLI